jgi:DNA repair protein RadC
MNHHQTSMWPSGEANDRMADATRPARFDRLYEALKVLLVQERFTLAQMKERLPHEIPGYITQLVHQLEREGHLRDNDGTYSWTCELNDFPAQSWVQAQVHGTQLLLTPEEDRPRERLLAHGAASLRTAELLAILIRVGRRGESALQAGEKIAARYNDRLHCLADAGRGELRDIASAIGDTAYCQIMAGIELGRRVAMSFAGNKNRVTRITDSACALQFCRDQFARRANDATQEEFHVVTLDVQLHVVGTHLISVGTLDRSLVHPREVFRPAIKDAAKSILLVHNHPSGDPTPSEEDLVVTSRLEEAGSTLGVPVLDHIVVAHGGAVSIREFLDVRASQKR